MVTPGVGMYLVIIAGLILTGLVALYIARNAEHGEARFGEDGNPLPTHPPEDPAKDMRVTITPSETSDD